MSTPSDDQHSSARQTQNPSTGDDALRELLQLARQSMDGPHTMLVMPVSGSSSETRIIGAEDLEFSDVCLERLLAAIEGADIQFDAAANLYPVITDELSFEPDELRIRWAAAGLRDGGALIACAPEPWEPTTKDHAILVGFARLISQHQTQEAASTETPHLRNLIAESARDGIIGIDSEGRCRYVNHAAAELLGVDARTIIDTPAAELFQTSAGEDPVDLHAFSSRDPVDYRNAAIQQPDGSSVPVDLTVVPNVEPDGQINGAVVRFSDLRAQMAAKAAAEHSEARHQAFLEMTLDSVVTIDRSGRVLEFNVAAEQTFRCSAEDVIGRRFSESLISPAWRQWWESAFISFSDHGVGPLKGRRVHITARRMDGSQFPADFTLTRIPLDDSWVYTLYIHDLTVEKANERRRTTRYAVTHILSETETPQDALPSVLETMCRGLEWDWAACWFRQPGSSMMELHLTWQAKNVDARALERVSSENGFDPGYGFLGEIWRRQSADWIEDLSSDARGYRRADVALSCGFHSLIAMPIIGRSEVIGVLEFHRRQRRERDSEMLRMLDSMGSQIGQFIERKQVEEERVQILAREQAARAEAEAAERRLAFLAEASAQLSSSLDYEVTLSNVARLAVPRLSDYCAIDVLNEENQITSLELADVNPEKEKIGRKMHEDHPVDPDSNHPVAQVMRSGRPILYSDVDEDVLKLFAEEDEDYLQDLHDIGIDSAMYVPLIARGRTIGVISFVASESGQRYGPSDLALAQELTRRAAMAIDNARLYREAQEAVRVREEFLSIASHELKTPLTTVKGYSQILGRLLRRPAVDTERLVRLADQLQDQLSRFETLIADLLDVSRIQQRGLELRPEPTDLVTLIRTVLSRFEYPADPEPQHIFAVHAPERLDGVWDPDRLDQVLTNLISNAIKYSPEGGVVSIAVALLEEDQVEFSVTDQGIGIPETEQPQLFRPFARSETVQRAISGVGLGLYISQQIVTRHGGTITLDSTPGVGSRFTVWLPRDYPAHVGDLDNGAGSPD
jgi:PAS domain S-box-containing protein